MVLLPLDLVIVTAASPITFSTLQSLLVTTLITSIIATGRPSLPTPILGTSASWGHYPGPRVFFQLGANRGQFHCTSGRLPGLGLTGPIAQKLVAQQELR